MAGSLTALTTTWNGLPSGSTFAKLNAINAMLASGPVIDIQASVIETYLINRNKRTSVFNFALTPPSLPNASALLAANYLVAIIQGVDGGVFRAASEPTLLGIMANLTADARTGILAADITALNTAAQPNVPWWQANGFTAPIGLPDLMAAGNLF